VARVEVPDCILQQLGRLAESRVVALSEIEFMDIAGLVKGAHSGSGM